MRLALALCLLSGCLIEEPRDEDPYYGSGSGSSGGSWGSGWGGGGGTIDYGCSSDAACGVGSLCTRTGECLPASQVRAVHTYWTVAGKTASSATCTNAPNLAITFSSGAGEQMGYTPVPCRAGLHTVDKFPTRFTSVQLAIEGDYAGGDSATFDADGNAQLDLPY